MHFKGMLFDLDGTLVNSLDAVEATWGEWADRRGLDRATVQHYVHGKPALSVPRHFMPEASSETIAKEFSQLETYESSHTDGITPVPGAVAFLTHLNQISAPWAVVTSGSLKVAAARIRQASLPFPDVLITSENVQQGKPHPEPFLLGASQLGLPAYSCVAFEDSGAGLTSARQAGCVVIELLTPQSVIHDMETYLTITDYHCLSTQRKNGDDFLLTVLNAEF
ncbi:HAD-IA family hydrolase [Klebsiella michiganensis]